MRSSHRPAAELAPGIERPETRPLAAFDEVSISENKEAKGISISAVAA